MSCQDCVFQDSLDSSRVPVPCQSCQEDSSHKGYCLATESDFGFVPIITRISDRNHALSIQKRAHLNGSALILLSWSAEANAYQFSKASLC